MRWLVICVALVACEGSPSQKSAPPAAGSAAPAGSAKPLRHLELVDAPAAGDVTTIIADEVALAARDHVPLVVYVGASWCEPCRAFHEAAEAGTLDADFGGVRFLVFDADRDGEALAAAGYKSELIPLFAIPTADGRASGRQIEGAVKGPNGLASITSRLRPLIDGR